MSFCISIASWWLEITWTGISIGSTGLVDYYFIRTLWTWRKGDQQIRGLQWRTFSLPLVLLIVLIDWIATHVCALLNGHSNPIHLSSYAGITCEGGTSKKVWLLWIAPNQISISIFRLWIPHFHTSRHFETLSRRWFEEKSIWLPNFPLLWKCFAMQFLIEVILFNLSNIHLLLELDCNGLLFILYSATLFIIKSIWAS